MSNGFEWIEPYKKIADKLLDFKDDRGKILEDIENVYKQISLKYPFIDAGEPLTDIDPFTVFATFNRGITDKNRSKIIRLLMKKWNIEGTVSEIFYGIPLVNNMSAWFFAGKDQRDSVDINQLWNLFELAINYSNNPNDSSTAKLLANEFNKVKSQKVIIWKITIGLFWIRPETFINLDGKTRDFLIKHNILDGSDISSVPSGDEYLKICKTLKTEMIKPPLNINSFPELSHKAYIELKEPAIVEEKIEHKPSEDNENQFFWMNINSKVRARKGDELIPGNKIEYSWGEKDKATVRRVEASSKIKPGDQVILVDIEPDSGIFARAEVVSHPHQTNRDYYKSSNPNAYVFDMEILELFSKQPRGIISKLPSFEENKVKSFLKGVSISKLNQDQFNEIITYITQETDLVNESIQTITFDKPLRIESLYFENKDQIERQINTALIQEKNIIFTGPPGTGKSKLAKAVADFYLADYKMVTASSNWSTYETLGGYHPNKENELEFKPGLFLTCVKDSLTGDNINQWLIIDELNRADIDKAFGSFFSVVTGDTVSLPFESEKGQLIQLTPERVETKQSNLDHLYVYPKDWRLIATMNTADKSSLFELSYAFMRRFAFINIGVPKTISSELIENYLNAWGVTGFVYSTEVAQLWSILNRYRKMGPAIIEDIVRYMMVEPNLTDAILLYVMPQLEGMLKDDIARFIEMIDQDLGEHIDSATLKEFAGDFFGDAL